MARPTKSKTTMRRRGAELHPLVARAIAIAGERPPRVHASGPAAKIVANEGPAAFEVARWSVHVLAALVPDAERAAFEQALRAIDEVAKLRAELVHVMADREIRMGPGYRQLRDAAAKLPAIAGSSQPIVAARATLAAFQCVPGGYGERAVGHAGDAIEATVRALQASGGDVARYVAELDRRTLVAEVYAIGTEYSLYLPEVTRVMWRGADAKGPAYWLFSIANGELGLVCKLGRRWHFTHGARDHVLATIPDTHFAAAVDWIATEI